MGAIPGFSAANTIIVLLPFTFLMEVEVGLFYDHTVLRFSRLGAGIPAILVNIPGTAGAAATPLDGYPMAKQGLGQRAPSISFVSSILGGLLTTVIALLTMPWLASRFLHAQCRDGCSDAFWNFFNCIRRHQGYDKGFNCWFCGANDWLNWSRSRLRNTPWHHGIS